MTGVQTCALPISLQGFIQFTLSGIIAGTVAPILDRSLVGLASGMAAFTLASFALWLAYLHRNRAPSPT